MSNQGGGSAAAAGPSRGGGAGADNREDPEWIKQMLAANPDQLAMLKQVGLK